MSEATTFMSEQDQLFESLLEHLRNGDECHNLEAKRGSAIDTSIMETVCAYCNEPGMGGGHIVLGVARSEDKLFPDYEVVGLDDPDKVQASEKPVFFKSKGLPKGAFRRIGSSHQTCTEDDIALFYQGRGHKAYEDSILEDMSLELDLSEEAIQGYRQRRERINLTAPENAWSKEELLFALGAASRTQDGFYSPTICGLICFGKDAALRRLAPMVRVDYIRVPGKVWIENPDTRFETMEMRGSLLTLIPRVIASILDDLPRGFSLEDGIYRKDILLVPDAVIREAVVNALMHRNYRTKQPVQIIRYSNRLEIRNPGCSLKPDDLLGEAGSVNRNEKIAAILHECNLAETKGSGIRVMQELMERANLSSPYFESNRDADSFVLTLLTHHFMDATDIIWLAEFKRHQLSDEEARALVFLNEFGAISNAAYRAINKVDTLHASASLRRLRNTGILIQKGKGTATYYQAGPAFIATLEAASPLQGSEALSPNLDGLSPNLNALPPDIQVMVEGLGARAKPETSKNVIVAICGANAYSKKELAGLLGRSEVTVGDLLGELLSEGRLTLEYPETPNNPQQKYRKVCQGGEE
jgi:ATP-dependent DNA helicase RecG